MNITFYCLCRYRDGTSIECSCRMWTLIKTEENNCGHIHTHTHNTFCMDIMGRFFSDLFQNFGPVGCNDWWFTISLRCSPSSRDLLLLRLICPNFFHFLYLKPWTYLGMDLEGQKLSDGSFVLSSPSPTSLIFLSDCSVPYLSDTLPDHYIDSPTVRLSWSCSFCYFGVVSLNLLGHSCV